MSCFQGVVIVNAGQKDAHSRICFQLLCLFLKKTIKTKVKSHVYTTFYTIFDTFTIHGEK